MALGDAVGKIAVDEVNSVTLPAEAKIITDALSQIAVIANGLLTGVEGERLAAMAGLSGVATSLLAESRAWRTEIAAWRDLVENRGFSLGGMPLAANPPKVQS